jgi:haloalkane dehalogenase
MQGRTTIAAALWFVAIGLLNNRKSLARTARFIDYARYLNAWFDVVELGAKVTLVGHDWGGALAFHQAFRHPNAIAAIAYMETFVQPRRRVDLSAAAQDSSAACARPKASG